MIGVEEKTTVWIDILRQFGQLPEACPKGFRRIAGEGLLPVVGRRWVTHRHECIVDIEDGIMPVCVHNVEHGESLQRQGLIELGEVPGLVHVVPLFQGADLHVGTHPDGEDALFVAQGCTIFTPEEFAANGYGYAFDPKFHHPPLKVDPCAVEPILVGV